MAAKLLSILAIGLLLAGAAAAEEIDHAEVYEICLALVAEDPEEAFETALAWQPLGGDEAAEHCAALAINGLGLHRDAAERLEELAKRLDRTRPEMTPDVLAQAARAWLMAGESERAYGVLTAALELRPEDVELLVDRAIALAQAESYEAARQDLSRALAYRPERPDILLLRASALRRLGELEAGLADAERALALAPRSPEAHLERGNLRRLLGDEAGARDDWVQAASLAGSGPTAEAAHANLAALDLKIE